MTHPDGTHKPNHYDLLGVPIDADKETIRKAYKKKSREVHPDHRPNEQARANKEMSDLTLACETLIDPDRRKAYDDALPPKPSFIPDQIDFGEVVLGQGQKTLLLTLRNHGGKCKRFNVESTTGTFWRATLHTDDPNYSKVEITVSCNVHARLKSGPQHGTVQGRPRWRPGRGGPNRGRCAKEADGRR